MATLIAAQKSVSTPFRPVIDGRSFTADPYYTAAPAVAANVPVIAGCANTETTYYFYGSPKSFSLEYADVGRRLGRFLGTDAAVTSTIIDRYRSVYPAHSPSDILVAATTDYLFKRNTYRIAALQSLTASAPVYAYVFAYESPVDGGRFHSPHTSEVPFVFGTTAVADAIIGSGGQIAPMTNIMMASWASFARTGDPNNPAIPAWKPYKDGDRQTMILKPESQLAADPGGEARVALDALPYYEYSTARESFAKD
jgi:para-nitrobenzyl esterase